MQHRFYADERILHLDLNSGVTAQRALAQAIPLLEGQPDLWSWDWVIDTRAVPTDASVCQIARLAELFRKPEAPVVTAFATDDRFLHLWARVMDFQFPGRKHLIVSSAAAGFRLINTRRASTKMN
ncbi:MAG: hypothetical protein EON88_11800 [Brevundimonas sp.]|nr:MAG: hypothetical protein EON88_11800 [Brevundimonas sp.]